jgi:hypothetical protein
MAAGWVLVSRFDIAIVMVRPRRSSQFKRSVLQNHAARAKSIGAWKTALREG